MHWPGSEPLVACYTVVGLAGLARVGTTDQLLHCDFVGWAGQLRRLANKAGSEPQVGRYTVTVLVGLSGSERQVGWYIVIVLVGLGRVRTTGQLLHCWLGWAVRTVGQLLHCDCVSRIGQSRNYWSAATL